MLWGADSAMQKKLKYPLVAETAICYNIHSQDIRRRLAARPVAPTEWNTTVVCRKADEPERENMFQQVARLDRKMCGHSFAGEWSLPEKLD